MTKKKIIQEQVSEEIEEVSEEVEVEPVIKKKTNRKLVLKEQAENGNDNIEKIVAYKKKTTDKQSAHLEKARKANKQKIENTKLKMNELELIKRENELLKKELEFSINKRKTVKKEVVEQSKPVKKQVQFQEPPKPNFYGIM